jgi:ABC-type transport system involved in cytochrome c biogenesis permease subunit
MINFNNIATVCLISWTIASVLILCKKQKIEFLAYLFISIGIGAIFLFIIDIWLTMGRAPMRTLGETRLWYGLFLPIIGYIAYLRWRYKWLLIYSLGMGSLFLFINVLKPETFDKVLMPALQSPWFVPHVVVYMFAYALLGVSSFFAIKGLYQLKFKTLEPSLLLRSDNLVYMGVGMLSLGLIFGALWAKEAWGHYWTWDPKETWALLTWLVYLLYIHFRYKHKDKTTVALIILSISYITLLVCWFGLNYMASGLNSVHTYSR